jgi:hypothetical protein
VSEEKAERAELEAFAPFVFFGGQTAWANFFQSIFGPRMSRIFTNLNRLLRCVSLRFFAAKFALQAFAVRPQGTTQRFDHPYGPKSSFASAKSR